MAIYIGPGGPDHPWRLLHWSSGLLRKGLPRKGLLQKGLSPNAEDLQLETHSAAEHGIILGWSVTR